ncbi:MAG: TolC family protein [Bacteroidales bacterium]|jgi:outer membrane protein TolC|nr:TolC family protein [Bacteroidales bacterium]
MIKKSVLLLTIGCCTQLPAQEIRQIPLKYSVETSDLPVLTLKDAITEGLENNYRVRIEKNNVQVSSNNASIGNAGMLPSIALNGTISESVADSHLKYFSDLNRPDQDKSGAISDNMNANLALNWTLFDGMSMFANYHRLKELELMGKEQMRAAMQETVASIINAYFDIVTCRKELEAVGHILLISKQRTHSANDMFRAGKVSKVDLLSAQVDYNADTSSYIQLNAELMDAKIRLNRLLARDIVTDFSVEDSIAIDRSLNYKDIHDKAIAENPEITLSRMSVNEAIFSLKAVQGARLPQVRFTSSYTLVNQQNGTGQIETTRSGTLNYGVTASIPLFDGLNLKRQIKNARLNKENADLVYEETQKEIEARVATAFNAYEVNRNLAAFEKANLSIAAENLDMSMERYHYGAISAVELREVQRSYLSATNRMIVAVYNAKIAETALKLLTGEMMKL